MRSRAIPFDPADSRSARQTEYLKNAGGKNSLEDQGWAVIIPEGDEESVCSIWSIR